MVGGIMITMRQRAPDSKVHGANMEPIWDRKDPGGPHVGPMNFAIWGAYIILKQDQILSHLGGQKGALFPVSWVPVCHGNP